MRRSITLIVTLAFCSFSILFAQDAQLLNQYDYIGTARYTAMAGAMSSVGADPSAVLDNPAGLALFRRFDITLSLHEQLDFTKQNGEKDSEFRSSCMLPQASFVFAFENKNEFSPLRFNNFMFSFNRLHTFNRTSWGHAFNQPSISHLMLEQADGQSEQTISNSIYNDPNTGWLSELGYRTYMIDPFDIDQKGDTIFDTWSSVYNIQPVNGIRIRESGGIDEFNIHWAGLFSQHWALGLGLNIRWLDYNKETSYEETFIEGDNTNYAKITSYLHQDGIGVSGSVGLLYQPLRSLRLGLSLQTPTAMSITTQTDAEMYLKDGGVGGNDKTLLYRHTARLTQPLRTTTGITFIGGQKGLVSLQYDFRHYKNTYNIHTMKIGGEYVINNNFFLNCGYACESAFLKNEPPTVLALNDVRTDAEYRTIGISHIAAAGFGFRNQHFVAQLAYRFRHQAYDIYPYVAYNTLPDAYNMTSMTHNIVLTIGWHTAN